MTLLHFLNPRLAALLDDLERWLRARPRDIDQLATLTPRVVVRDDGFAYITFTRPAPQKAPHVRL